MKAAGLRGNAHRHRLIAFDEVRAHAPRLADDLDTLEALQDLLPHHLELHLGQALADAAMDAEAERDVLAWARPIDDELVRILDHIGVAVARDVPHDHLVALLDLFAAELDILLRRAAHMRDGALPADNLRHHGVDERRIGHQL